MLINQIPWEREEKREIFVSKEKYSQQFEWLLVLEEWNRYIIVTKHTDCYLKLKGYAFIGSSIKIKILWYRYDRLHLNSQFKVYLIWFIS